MSEVDKDLSERYRAASREEPHAHIDAAILAAAKRAVGSQPQGTWTPRAVRRWYVPVSLAAVIVLSVVVTLQVERERPEIAMPDAVPVERKERDLLSQTAPAPPPTPGPKSEAGSAVIPPTEPARMKKSLADAPRSADDARGPAAAGQIAAPASPAFAPDPKPAAGPEAKPATEPAPMERQRQEALRAVDATRESPAAAGVAAEAAGARRDARVMSAPASAPAAAKSNLAKRELAPDEWLERIAELRKLNRDREADEQLAEFKRRYPEYKIPEAMSERIAPRK